MKKLIILFLLISQITFAQTSIVTETINEIEFEEDSIKSVFDWLANNIRYDVKKMKQIENGSIAKKHAEFRTEKEYDDYLLQTVIKRKKGVCQDYALLFDAIVGELGYESYIVEGYTKRPNGKINRKIGHVWNAIKVNGTWKLYDATWGAGHVRDGKRFVRSYSAEWYDVSSKEMLKTHMPFDPIWQLSRSPINYSDFENNTESTKSGVAFDYASQIEGYLYKSDKEQMQDKVSRSKSLGNGIRLIAKWRKTTTKNVNLFEILSQPELLDEANEKYNKSIDLFNDYINAKNKRFRGKKWTVDYAKENLQSAKSQMTDAVAIFKSVKVEDKKANRSLAKAARGAEKLLARIGAELAFLEKM